jgi:hypothetical protein
MPIPLPDGTMFAYSVAPGATATIANTGGHPVDYAAPTAAGGFGEPLGTIDPGDSVEVDAPGVLRSEAGSEVEIDYPMTAPPIVEPPDEP